MDTHEHSIQNGVNMKFGANFSAYVMKSCTSVLFWASFLRFVSSGSFFEFNIDIFGSPFL